MKIEKTQVFGFEAALRGMRNPLDSWDKSDSYIGDFYSIENIENFTLGDNDKNLAQRLTKAGSEHCKFLRQIQVWVDLTLPRYIWSEFDTYKFNTKNSCSTIHTIHRIELTQDDFEQPIPPATLSDLNMLIREKKLGHINNSDFIHMIKNRLPEGFLQMRTVNTNYAELANIYFQRRQHKLNQWHEICKWIEELPYFKELVLSE